MEELWREAWLILLPDFGQSSPGDDVPHVLRERLHLADESQHRADTEDGVLVPGLSRNERNRVGVLRYSLTLINVPEDA